MAPNRFDVVVVGGGPAGLSAAIAAARKGRRVCLLDRKERPGVPVRCGEGIGLKGFARGGLTLRPEWILTTIRNARLVSPSGIKVDIPDIPESYVIDRERMESDLFDDARKAGVDCRLRTAVSRCESSNGNGYVCRTASGEFVSPCVVLADGVESRLARDVGWRTALAPRDVEPCAFCRVSGARFDEGWVTMYTGSSVAPSGYAWVFPRGGDSANVGLGILGNRSSPGEARRLLEAFLAKHFPVARVDHLHCGGAPVARWTRPLVRGGVMIVGDAARQVNAVSGAGIAYSVIAGGMAGRAAADAFGGSDFASQALRRYEREWASFYGKQQMRSYALKEIVVEYDDVMLDRIASGLAGGRAGTLNYVKLFVSAFRGKPLHMLKAFLLFK